MRSIVKKEGNGLIFTVLAESEDEKEINEWTEILKRIIKEVFEEYGPVRVLTDLTNITFTESLTIRKKVSEMEMENAQFIRKSAAYTSNLRIRWLANLIATWSGRKNFEVFKTRETALKWLNLIDRNQVIRESIHEVYSYIKKNPSKDEIDTLNHVRGVYNYSESEDSELVLEFFNLQQGLAYVTYYYIKNNPDKSEVEILEDIQKNYTRLLNEYYLKEHKAQK